MEDAIVLYPSPAIGHLVSMVELGKLLLKRYPSFSIKILISHPPYNTGSTAPYISRVSATTPITFHHLPTISLPSHLNAVSHHHEVIAFEFLRLNNPHVRHALLSISQTSTVHALVMDFFCYTSIPVVHQLNIPAYCFFTSGASFLASYLYMPTLHNTTTLSLKDMDTFLDVPAGIPPIHSSDILTPMQDRTDKAYEGFLNAAIDLPKLAGILANTFDSLEPRGLKALLDGVCVPDKPMPPVYCIGPLIAADGRTGGDVQKHESLAWLNSQPSGSVVFLCFGSLGKFTAGQLKEIAIGLERSGQRFLWVVRNPPTDDPDRRFLVPPEPDLDSLLPEGFLGRTRDRGLVVKQWAPQTAVLSHDSVGGFVTHCGWNSALEAISAGIPMVAWPLYAEQRFNRVLLVEELKLALPMTESDGGIVSAAEVEKRVRDLMTSEQAKLIRERIKAKREEGKAAMGEGGSSPIALANWVQSWKTA